MEVLKEYGLEELILGETGDNASMNDKTLDELETLFQELLFSFTHILNLVVKVRAINTMVSNVSSFTTGHTLSV